LLFTGLRHGRRSKRRKGEGWSVERVTITIDDDLLMAVDAFASRRGYQSRSEAIRDIVRDVLTGDASAEPRKPCVATLSYVYDHHKHDLAKRLTESQHEHHDLTVAAMHVHLDHDTCLEVAVLKGRRGAVEELAHRITSQRGVRYGRLHIISAAGAKV
jgi:CopG family nickel-responsive transcriptional regulator